MDRVVPVKVRECERELRRREEIELTRQTQTDERVDRRNLKNSGRQLPYPLCFDFGTLKARSAKYDKNVLYVKS